VFLLNRVDFGGATETAAQFKYLTLESANSYNDIIYKRRELVKRNLCDFLFQPHISRNNPNGKEKMGKTARLREEKDAVGDNAQLNAALQCINCA
jgi:hypothetical protein